MCLFAECRFESSQASPTPPSLFSLYFFYGNVLKIFIIDVSVTYFELRIVELSFALPNFATVESIGLVTAVASVF